MATAKMPEKCVECDYLLRAKGEKLADHPGTKAHFGRGLCSSCYGASRPITNLSEFTKAKVSANRRGLDGFLASRQKRDRLRSQRAKLRMVVR